MDLKKFLKFRLKKWKNKDFEAFVHSLKREGEETHHLILKQNSDLFLVNIPVEQHKRIHIKGYEEGEFEELFIEAIKNIQKYIDDRTIRSG